MEIYEVFKHALMITIFVFVMMLVVDILDMLTEKRLTSAIKGGIWRQYTIASFLGTTPGCLGSFMNISLYIHGMLSFGALVGGMVATSGDGAFVMLAEFPETALLLFGLLFLMAIPSAWISDKVAAWANIIPCESCELHEYHPEREIYHLDHRIILENLTKFSFQRHILLLLFTISLLAIIFSIVGPHTWGWKRVTLLVLLSFGWLIILIISDHYLKEHIWSHIVKRHIWKVFLWTFFALLVVHMGLDHWSLESFVKENILWMLFFSALVGIIPESGPHLIFVMLYAEGLIPFSVLLTSSFVQDGHGMLPLLSYTIKDSILIKLFNLVLGLVAGLILYSMGL